MPMGFKAYRFVIAGITKGTKLSCPVNESSADRRPLDFAVRIFHGVLYMAVVDAVFGQQGPGCGESVEFAAHDGVGGIPVENEVGRLNCIERAYGFATGGGVAFEFVFEDEQDAMLGGYFRGGSEFLVDGSAVGSDIVKAPEVEAANFIGIELFGERNRTFEQFVLVFEGHFDRSVHVAFGAIG